MSYVPECPQCRKVKNVKVFTMCQDCEKIADATFTIVNFIKDIVREGDECKTYCPYCDTLMRAGSEHAQSCVYIKAKKLLEELNL